MIFCKLIFRKLIFRKRKSSQMGWLYFPSHSRFCSRFPSYFCNHGRTLRHLRIQFPTCQNGVWETA
jgi:hypothetical protein